MDGVNVGDDMHSRRRAKLRQQGGFLFGDDEREIGGRSKRKLAGLHAAPGGQMRIWAEAHGDRVWLGVVPTARDPAPEPLRAECTENLEMARQLAAVLGAGLEVTCKRSERCPFAATFILPTAEQAMVLAIDDNDDALQLYQRYLEPTPYAFVGAKVPEQALALIDKLRVRAIVLDVMLPGIDGWDLLGRLYEHPRTRGVPIIICSILPQERLALALGAAAFLRKPVTRAAFLAALDRVLRSP